MSDDRPNRDEAGRKQGQGDEPEPITANLDGAEWLVHQLNKPPTEQIPVVSADDDDTAPVPRRRTGQDGPEERGDDRRQQRQDDDQARGDDADEPVVPVWYDSRPVDRLSRDSADEAATRAYPLFTPPSDEQTAGPDRSAQGDGERDDTNTGPTRTRSSYVPPAAYIPPTIEDSGQVIPPVDATLSGAVPPDVPPAAVPPVAVPGGQASPAGTTPVAPPTAAPRSPAGSPPSPGDGSPFRWDLRPNDDLDPIVHGPGANAARTSTAADQAAEERASRPAEERPPVPTATVAAPAAAAPSTVGPPASDPPTPTPSATPSTPTPPAPPAVRPFATDTPDAGSQTSPVSAGPPSFAEPSVLPRDLRTRGSAPGRPQQAARSEGSPRPPAGPRPPRGPGSGPGGPHWGRIAALAGAAVVLLALIVGAFWIGRALPGMFAAQEPPTPTPPPTTAAPVAPETPGVQPVPGTQPPGTYAWNQLGGGECLEPFTTPWAEEFTVVDCAAPHGAQIVRAETWPADPATPFPGEEAIAAAIPGQCAPQGAIDLAVAAQFPDIQVQGVYPVTARQWDAGERTYYCFASRSSGEPLTTSVLAEG